MASTQNYWFSSTYYEYMSNSYFYQIDVCIVVSMCAYSNRRYTTFKKKGQNKV